ncbi:hypothetical protein EXIGLDRAFT_724228, partial [Exidia glandulosa HHB12029]
MLTWNLLLVLFSRLLWSHSGSVSVAVLVTSGCSSVCFLGLGVYLLPGSRRRLSHLAGL